MKKTEVDIRREKLASIMELGFDPFSNDFKVSHTVGQIRDQIEKDPDSLGEEGPSFCAAGRLMAVNKFGKSAFVRFRDRTGQMQAYIRKDKLDEKEFALFKLLDVGDFVGVCGTLFVTRTGEWTLLVTRLQVLCKALRPLPEKFHGIRDPEKRYRQRYLDLVMNEDSRNVFITRSKVIAAVREFFLGREFLEVETPMMQPIPGGAEARPFITHHNALDMTLYLRIAPELYLKRLVVGGLDRVFEINRNFRNEGIDTQHNPEFTMLEFYQAYATYDDLVELTQELFAKVAKKVTGGSTKLSYQGQEIEFGGTWQRLTMAESLEKFGGMDPALMNDREGLLEFAKQKGLELDTKARTGKLVTKLFDILVEPNLIQPTFIVGYPVEVSPLSRRNAQNPELVDRFELFIAGREIANGFSELNDPDDQRGRFEQQVADREAGDDEAHFMDTDYVEALEYGMPPTAGEGIGIDRLVMLFSDAASIRDVIFFPHMRFADTRPEKSKDEPESTPET